MKKSSRLKAKWLICCFAFTFVPNIPGQQTVSSAEAGSTDELKFAVIVTRHGVRSPTWTAERLNQYSAAAWPDFGVAPGELTLHGRELVKLMGGYYREYFVSQGLLGKAACDAEHQPFFRADTAQRTMATAQALAEAILPGCSVEIHSAGKDKDGKEKADPLFEGAGNMDAALSMAAVAGRLGPQPDSLTSAHRPALDLLDRMLRGNGRPAHSILEDSTSLTTGKSGVTLNGPISLASTLTEDFFLEYADGMSGDQLGWGRVNTSNLLELMSLHTAYAELTRRTSYLARARGSNLLNYVMQSFEQAVSGNKTPLIVVSGHDTNISNLSGMLGLSWLLLGYQADDAPPGGALIFALWRSAATGKYSVRLRFVAQTPDQMHNVTPLSLAHPPAITDVFVPGCSSASEGYPCGWEAFRRTANAAIAQEFVSK